MVLFITKQDLPDFVKFTLNTPDKDINPDIRDAHEFDVMPLLNVSQHQALLAYRALPAEELAAYVALSEADKALSAIHKPSLLFAAVRGLLCHETYRRFLLTSGLHQTQNGMEVISDVGHVPITNAQRTELRADAQAKCAIYRSRLLTALRAFSNTASTYCHAGNKRLGAGGLKTYAV